MKVKIGNNIYDAENEPIMIILSNADKKNIKNMSYNATKFCTFPEGTSKDEIKIFMSDLYKGKNLFDKNKVTPYESTDDMPEILELYPGEISNMEEEE